MLLCSCKRLLAYSEIDSLTNVAFKYTIALEGRLEDL
jgi:hypothetical protein